MRLYVGTSGYSYKEWKGTFYPEKISASEMLEFYASRFDSVEINSTFYRMPSENMLTGWVSQVPDRFTFVLKMPRKVTHLKRLNAIQDEMDYLTRVLGVLGGKLGPMLVQLPPNFTKDIDRLQAFLDTVPPNLRMAFEFRNESWFDDDLYDVLRDRNLALVAADGEKVTSPVEQTADWGYVRLRKDDYDGDHLKEWSARLQSVDWKQVFVFFKHEGGGVGPELATTFAQIFEQGRDKR